MAEVIPFRGLRYNPRFVPDLAAVVAPPYDVISPEAQARYHARHPYNVVWLTLPENGEAGRPEGDRYAKAAASFAAWRREGILQRDSLPTIYLYEQEFSIGEAQRVRRRGVLALVRLHEYAEGVIYPHERTFARFKDDRLRLMRACPANLEAILGFCAGPNSAVEAVLGRTVETGPAVRLVDEDGIDHRVWLVRAPAEIATLQAALRDRPIVIADGHHRYETALNFRNERRTGESDSPDTSRRRPDSFVLLNLVHADDPGLIILPTHRVIRRQPRRLGEALRTALASHFRMNRFPLDPASPMRSLRLALAELARRRGALAACAIYAGGPDILVIELDDPAVPQALRAEGHAPAYAELDVAILHRLVIEEILGIPPASQADDAIDYMRDESRALEAVLSGGAHAALFLNPPQVSQVQAVAMAGERMPQKSTYFFPKVLSGLVMHPIDAGEFAL